MIKTQPVQRHEKNGNVEVWRLAIVRAKVKSSNKKKGEGTPAAEGSQDNAEAAAQARYFTTRNSSLEL
jgi:hypothetical protein